MIKSIIADGTGSPHLAKVTPRGQVVVGPLDYNLSEARTMSTTDVYSFYSPRGGHRFLLDAVVISGSNGISASGAIVTIYASETAGGLSTDPGSTVLLRYIVPAKSSDSVTRLNLLSSPGKWINATTDSTTVYMSLLGYYLTS